ncbi:MAG: endo alpha-1,4 polygalactosaminidase [Hyphomicrobiaceae bacterium]|nr:endo alpha-1,4 polygalactosaminidase [Hyphomicrobiaceae bacterium]
MRYPKTTLVLTLLVVVAGVLAVGYALRRPASPLAAVQSWDYQLQKLDLDRLARSKADMLVIDYSRTGHASGALTQAEVQRLQERSDGRRRLVIAYLSIGEAEEYRYYWRPEWKTEPPPWLFAENCRWPGNHLVRYWLDGWKEIVFRSPDSYLSRIVAAGFDGVYLDRVDAFWDLRERYPDGRAHMIELVGELAAHARRLRPGFLVIAQNAEALLDSPDYRASIDAVAKEDLLNGVSGTAIANDAALIGWSLDRLRLLTAEGKPVLAVEYLRTSEAIRAASARLTALGFLATFPTRALDGRDPLEPDPPALHETTGTPEFSVKHCL